MTVTTLAGGGAQPRPPSRDDGEEQQQTAAAPSAAAPSAGDEDERLARLARRLAVLERQLLSGGSGGSGGDGGEGSKEHAADSSAASGSSGADAARGFDAAAAHGSKAAKAAAAGDSAGAAGAAEAAVRSLHPSVTRVLSSGYLVSQARLSVVLSLPFLLPLPAARRRAPCLCMFAIAPVSILAVPLSRPSASRRPNHTAPARNKRHPNIQQPQRQRQRQTHNPIHNTYTTRTHMHLKPACATSSWQQSGPAPRARRRAAAASRNSSGWRRSATSARRSRRSGGSTRFGSGGAWEVGGGGCSGLLSLLLLRAEGIGSGPCALSLCQERTKRKHTVKRQTTQQQQTTSTPRNIDSYTTNDASSHNKQQHTQDPDDLSALPDPRQRSLARAAIAAAEADRELEVLKV